MNLRSCPNDHHHARTFQHHNQRRNGDRDVHRSDHKTDWSRRARNVNRNNSGEKPGRSPSTSSITINPTAVLKWPDPRPYYVPVEEEERLLPALIYWGKTERGMMKDQPAFRLKKIQHLLSTCRPPHGEKKRGNNKNKNAKNGRFESNEGRQLTRLINLSQSLSLRRTHLKLINPRLSMAALRLGSDKDIRNAAFLFEQCVEKYLTRQNIKFVTEKEQQRRFSEGMGNKPPWERKNRPTPDFMIDEGQCVVLSPTLHGSRKQQIDYGEPYQLTGQNPVQVHWIEAKMFYGASTIPSGTPNAVGAIIPKVRSYVSLYGPGAIVFMYGCGNVLAKELDKLGVVALDGRGLDLSCVERQQLGWCADKNGFILP